MAGNTFDYSKLHFYSLPKLNAKAIQEFQGFASVIIFDGELSDSELQFIEQWLVANAAYLDSFPLSTLAEIFTKITADKVVTQNERLELFNFLNGIANLPAESSAIPKEYFDYCDRITIANSRFAFTGDFLTCDRQKLEDKVENNGGKVTNSVSKFTDYLIVGDLPSDLYKFGRYGTKFQGAMDLKKKCDAKIKIVSERDFLKLAIF